MAGGAVMSNSKGGRKPLDASINLVPFIDLLSCCISFLLITAVWVNLSQQPVRVGPSGEGGEAPTPSVQLTLIVTPDSYLLTRSTGESVRMEAQAGQLPYAALATTMRQVKRDLPEKADITVRSSDGVLYDHLIKTIDVLRAEQFPGVNVTDTGHNG